MTAPRCPCCLQEYASEPCALHRAGERMWEGLTEALGFAEDREDVDDGDGGVPKPNAWMRVATILRAAIPVYTRKGAHHA